MNATALSPAEMIFAQRMLPHFMAGRAAAEAAQAVLADDERLFIALHDRSHSFYIPTADERGLSGTTRLGAGDVIANELSGAVYARLRASQAS